MRFVVSSLFNFVSRLSHASCTLLLYAERSHNSVYVVFFYFKKFVINMLLGSGI